MHTASLLRRLAFAVCGVFALASTAFADPALWVAHSDTATVYLFGTFHALRPDTHWGSAKLDKAIADAREIWLEIADPGDTAGVAPLVLRYGMDKDHTLSSKLTPDELARLDAAARKAGLANGAAALEAMRPWLAMQILDFKAIQAAGFSLTDGVDVALRAAGMRAGKPVGGLETAEQQIRMFADLPPADEVALLVETASDIEKEPDELSLLFGAWVTGDIDTLAMLLVDDDSPLNHRVIFADRNKAFAERVAAMLQASGTVLVAVGVGHFVGRGGMLELLEARGIKVERLQ